MNIENFRNKLIVFESPDHSGKTTITPLLTNYLNNNGIPTIATKQPGDLNYGGHAEIMHSLAKDKKHNLDPLTGLFVFLADRSENTSKIIEPALIKGFSVVCDRYWYSTIAYQFFGKQLLEKYNLNIEFAEWMNKVASHSVEPDIVFYFNRPDELIKTTIDNQNDTFETESDKFKQRVKKAYLMMCEKYKFNIINVDPDPQITLERILNYDEKI